MNDDFRVGVGTKAMAFAFELAAQISEVVDLSVERDPHRTIFVRHRHVAVGREVENREAPGAATDIRAVAEMAVPGLARPWNVRPGRRGYRIDAYCEDGDSTHKPGRH